MTKYKMKVKLLLSIPRAFRFCDFMTERDKAKWMRTRSTIPFWEGQPGGLPFREIHLVGGSSSPKVSAKICKVEIYSITASKFMRAHQEGTDLKFSFASWMIL